MPADHQPPIHETKAETFILESLSLEDEANDRFDGRILFQNLKIQGKAPKYYYFRTKTELVRLADEFRKTGYRYLHLSCHGNETCIQTSFDRLTFEEVGAAFEGKLNNRRLFISGCNLGNRQLAEAVFAKSGGMYSLIAPTKPIRFEQAAVFWSSFYYLMHSVDGASMKKEYIRKALKHCSKLFEVSMAYFHRDLPNDAAILEFRFAAPESPVLWAPAKRSPSDVVKPESRAATPTST